MKITPLADRVLIKMEQGEEKTKGGLFIPDTAKEKTQTGIVEAIGDDKDAISVKVGDKVMYDKYAGTSVEVDSAEYLIIKASDILAILS
ncbi:MAG: co-chaperone GroES [Spirochaetota bacterium]|jgi:chaperonin GroES